VETKKTHDYHAKADLAVIVGSLHTSQARNVRCQWQRGSQGNPDRGGNSLHCGRYLSQSKPVHVRTEEEKLAVGPAAGGGQKRRPVTKRGKYDTFITLKNLQKTKYLKGYGGGSSKSRFLGGAWNTNSKKRPTPRGINRGLAVKC